MRRGPSRRELNRHDPETVKTPESVFGVINANRSPAPGGAAAGEPLSALIIEHIRADAELMVAALEGAGFAVRADVVAMPGELPERLAAGRYDIVLADYRLPGWTALDALAQLRLLRYDTPLIV